MRTVLDLIRDAVQAHGLTLTKATPRGPGHLLLQMVDRDQGVVAGQWLADRQRAGVVAAETRARSGHVPVTVLADSGVLVQPGGADRSIPVLHRLVASPGAVLVAHRPERRGVVRRVEDSGRVTFTKVLRGKRLADTLARMRLDIDGVSLPRVLDSNPATGTISCEALPGSTLHDMLASPTTSLDELQRAGRAVGATIARLHATPPPRDLAHAQDAAAELEVTQRWLRDATMLGLVDRHTMLQQSLAHLGTLLADFPCPPAYVHGDLHDKQVLVDHGPTVGMLDFDLAAMGEPSLDLANLLVHLELRSVQGVCSRARMAVCAEAVLDGYRPRPAVSRRLPAYALATRLRLAAVYAFRPSQQRAGLALLAQGSPGPLHEMRVPS